MSLIGIEGISIYAPAQQFPLADLSQLRGHPESYFSKSSGHTSMAIPMHYEDVVTMAAEACTTLPCDLDEVSLVLFATESSHDQSKSQGIYLHRLLQLKSDCRVIELKQACYSGTAALQLAQAHVMRYPHEKVLIVASDIAFYEPNTIAEGSQGAGAVALLISSNAKIATLSDHAGFITEDHMDFWRPNHLTYPRVDGRLSCDLYIKLLQQCWHFYSKKSGLNYHDHDGFCFHTPLKKLAHNAHRKLLLKNKISPNPQMLERLEQSFLYATHIGNTYSASLMMCFASLIKHCDESLAEKRIAMYSYGSGCVAECFHLKVLPGYQNHLDHLPHVDSLIQRPILSHDHYSSLLCRHEKIDANIVARFSFLGHNQDQPQYERSI